MGLGFTDLRFYLASKKKIINGINLAYRSDDQKKKTGVIDSPPVFFIG